MTKSRSISCWDTMSYLSYTIALQAEIRNLFFYFLNFPRVIHIKCLFDLITKECGFNVKISWIMSSKLKWFLQVFVCIEKAMKTSTTFFSAFLPNSFNRRLRTMYIVHAWKFLFWQAWVLLIEPKVSGVITQVKHKFTRNYVRYLTC